MKKWIAVALTFLSCIVGIRQNESGPTLSRSSRRNENTLVAEPHNEEKGENQFRIEKADFDSLERNANIILSLEETVTDSRLDEIDSTEVMNFDLSENNLLISLHFLDKMGQIDFTYATQSDHVYHGILAFYIFKDTLTLSQISQEDAFYQAMNSRLSNGNITEGEIIDEYYTISHEGIEQEITSVPNEALGAKSFSSSATQAAGSQGDTIVQGHLTWKDEKANVFPLKDVHILLYDKEPLGFGVLADETYTDEEGNFFFSFDNPDGFFDFENGGADPYIRICAESQSFHVRRDWLLNYLTIYDRCSDVAENVETGSTTTFNICIENSSHVMSCNAFSIAQAMIEGQSFAVSNNAMDLDALPYSLNVAYPGANTSFSYKAFSGIEKGLWNDWAVILHEYGHYVENIAGTYGPNLAEIILNNPLHYIDTDHLSDKKSKQYGMELTWPESWASIFAMLIYQEIPEFRNISYTDNISNTIQEAINYSADASNSGEGFENCVISYLQKIYPLKGFEFLWTSSLRQGVYTLTDYQKVLEKEYSINRDDYGNILSANRISSYNLVLSNTPSSTTPPRFSWANGGSEKFPNDRFFLSFYNSIGKAVYRINDIPSSSNGNDENTQYTLTSSQWSELSKAFIGHSTCRVGVQAYQTGKNVISGPYSSVSIALNLPQAVVDYPTHLRYWETTGHLSKGEQAIFDLRVPVSTNYVIQSFGEADTILSIYDTEGNLLINDDDNGYGRNAYVFHSFDENQIIRISVGFYSSSYSGNYRVSIVPTEHFSHQDGVTSFDHFEGIWQITDYDNYSLHGYYLQNQSVFIRYMHISTGDFKISVTGDCDNYLYFIDPRSSNPISGSDYNDDSFGNLNPSITVHLEKGKDYLFVISRYDNKSSFANLESGDEFNLCIQKQ